MTFAFENQAFFERLTASNPYPEELLERDLPPEKRIAKRHLRPSSVCPFSAVDLEGFRTLEQGSDQWRMARNSFLSSSRFGVIADEHIEDAPEDFLHFWRESTGRIPPKIFRGKQLRFVNHGKKYEPVARSVYERLRGIPPLLEEGLRVEARAPYIYSASPDGIADDHLIEIKCRSIGALYCEPPHYYLPQIVGATAIYEKRFSDFVGYWTRDYMDETLMVCCRVYFDESAQLYWQRLRLRLDYMAWACINDQPPTGMRKLKAMYPLPPLRIEDQFYYEGRAELDRDPATALVNVFDPILEDNAS